MSVLKSIKQELAHTLWDIYRREFWKALRWKVMVFESSVNVDIGSWM